jgi:hypothetical protein
MIVTTLTGRRSYVIINSVIQRLPSPRIRRILKVSLVYFSVNSSTAILNLSGSVASTIAFRASAGKETRPNFSANLSHSIYFASIEY